MLRRLREKLLFGAPEPYVAVTLALVAGGLLLVWYTLSTNQDRWEKAWAEDFVRSSASPLAYGTSLEVRPWLTSDSAESLDGARYLHLFTKPPSAAAGSRSACDHARVLESAPKGASPESSTPRHALVVIGRAATTSSCQSSLATIHVSERQALQRGVFRSVRPATYVLLGPDRNVLYSRRELPTPERVAALQSLLNGASSSPDRTRGQGEDPRRERR